MSGCDVNSNRLQRSMSTDSYSNWHQRQRCLAEQERKNKADLIKRLEREFDMDATRKKYLSQNVLELVYEPGEFSVYSAQSTLHVRQRLKKLMGSEVIRLNDRAYTDELLQKLQDEYDKEQEEHAEQLEKAEVERIRKLRLEGLLPLEDESNKSHQNNSKRKSTKKNAEKTKDKYQDASRHLGIMKQVDEQNSDAVETQVEVDKRKQKLEIQREAKPSPTESLTKDKITKEKEIHVPNKSKEDSNSESTTLSQLRHEQTVEGLYRIADQILPAHVVN